MQQGIFRAEQGSSSVGLRGAKLLCSRRGWSFEEAQDHFSTGDPGQFCTGGYSVRPFGSRRCRAPLKSTAKRLPITTEQGPASGRRLGSRAEISTCASGSGSWRLRLAVLALVSGQVRPRLAAGSRDKWHQDINCAAGLELDHGIVAGE